MNARSIAALLLAGLTASVTGETSRAATGQREDGSSSRLENCMQSARARAAAIMERRGTPEQARRQLEIDAMFCRRPDLPPETAALLGTINADRARFARDLIAGGMTAGRYRAALEDRMRKLERLKGDVAAQRALMAGDADGDLVADSVDRCRNTPAGTPTNDVGCPLGRDDRHDDTKLTAERPLRELLRTARTLYNPSCDDAPAPATPMPLAWGRGDQTTLGTQGFNLMITQIGGMPAGCDLFYEIHFQFVDPASPGLPLSLHGNVVFHETEDLSGDPGRVVLGLPIGPPLSPGRAQAVEAFSTQYLKVRWRVRVVHGSNVGSPWSPVITQGPASGGVQG